MALFNFGKKKEEKKATACACNKGSSANEGAKSANKCCGKAVNGICCIKVLGAGCTACHKFYENTKSAARSPGLPVEVEYITDMAKVMEYGAMQMPVLVINEKVVSMGKVLKPADIEKLLRQFEG